MIDQKTIDKKSLEGRKFRFVVSSAEDAAQTIRERLGETARVLSVKQINGKGLAKFISSPQLEIVVEVPKREIKAENEVLKKAEEVGGLNTSNESKNTDLLTSPYRRVSEYVSKKTLETVLSEAGFEESFLKMVKNEMNWGQVCGLPLSNALAEFTRYLKRKIELINVTPVSRKVSFFGLPGAGSTTALCKFLATEVFLKNREAQVLKLENEMPNFDNALKIYCETLGVELLRDKVDLDKISSQKSLVIDVPGCVFREHEEWHLMKKSLDELDVSTRILVVNSIYDKNIIQNSFTLGERMNATHVVFTHLDEVVSLGKLWPFVFNSKIPVLFFSKGQNIAGDISDSIFNELVCRTFPSLVLN